jgi:hypothetical protein
LSSKLDHAEKAIPLNGDPDLALLASIASTLKPDYIDPATDPWEASPFAWIRSRPSRQRGKIGEQLVAGWAAAKGLDVTRPRDSGADRIINGKRIEIKFSTLWAAGGYTFQQIRDQAYDAVFLLALAPLAASAWIVPKEVLRERPFRVGLSHQHGGSVGTDTVWLRFQADRPPEWLAQYGGRLADAYRHLAT